MKRILAGLLSMMLIASVASAQNYNMSNTNQTTCSGNFYDSGGSGGNYAASESFSMTFTPSTAGQMLQFVFTAFSTESLSLDYLKIYNGPSTASPLIGTYGGTTSPGTITASNATGQLTFVWVSDGSVQNTGWAATISCVAPPPTYNFTNGSTITTCSGFFYDDGGTGNYPSTNNARVETFCSGTAQALKFVFSEFDTKTSADFLEIFDGPNTSSTLIGSYSTSNSPGTITSSGTCLTFRWTNNNNGVSTGWLANISCVAPPPANNECYSATALTVNPSITCATSTAGTVSQATASSQTNPCSGTADDDVWYSFVATSTVHYVTLSNVAGSTTDMYHAVYSGTCGSLTNIICSDADQSTVTGLTIGQTYYVRVYTYTSTAGQTSTFNICVTTPPPPPANDECTGAVNVPVNPTNICTSTVAGTVASSTASSQANSCYGTDDDDVWYKFTATNTTQLVSLTNIAGSTTDMYFVIYSGTCASLTSLLCSDANEATVTGLTVGQTYYIRVYTYTSTTSQTSTFNVCVGTPPPPPANDECTGSVALTVNPTNICTATTAGTVYSATASSQANGSCYGTADDDVWYTFVATNTTQIITLSNVTGSTTDMYFSVFSGNCSNPNNLLCSDADQATVTGLTVGQTYRIRVYTYTSTAGQTTAFNLCVGTPPPPPANDECSGVVSLPVNTDNLCTNYVTGTVYSATASSQANSCSGTSDDDVWYSFVATSTVQNISLNNVAGSTTDMYYAVYSGACNSLTNLVCSDANSGQVSGLVVGNTYYVRVYTYTSTAGQTSTFDMCVSTPAPTAYCAGADPFCTGTTYNFPAGVASGTGETGPEYGCLSSTPNPVWYYLQVATAGPIEMYIYGSNGYDVDFACWGPFNSPTGPCTSQLTTGVSITHSVAGASTDYPSENMIDCSYDSQDQEWCYIPNAQVGQYYILLLTNYSNLAQNIVFSQSGGAGATDCSIVAPPIINNGPLCVGQTLQLTVTNPVAGATYSWSGPHGFSSTQMNPTHANIQTVDAGVYSLVITVGGVSSAPVTTTVVVNPIPTISCPAAQTLAGCNLAVPAGATTPAAFTTLGGTTTGTSISYVDDAPTMSGCTETTLRTYTASIANCQATCTQNIIRTVDLVAPVITGSLNNLNIVGCSAAAAPAAVTTVAALEAMGVAISDNCTADASLVVTSSDGAPSGTCPTTITRTYTVKDACNNTATKTQTITINDNVAPVITGTITAANITGCSAAAAPVAVSTVAALEGMGLAISDNCTADASLVVSSSDGAPVGTCPMTITRTYTIKDACNNTTTATQTITINDNVAPVITGTITAASVVGCSAAAAPVAVTTVAALEGMGVAISDNCTADASLTVTSSDGAPTGTCPITITRTYTIKDACNNTATATQTITINDNVAPVITGTITAASVVGCSAASAPAAVTTVAALEGMGVAISDNCTADASLTVTSSDGAPTGTCPITITRTYTIKDACNNTATKTQTITINDNVAPVITGTITAASVVGCSAAAAPAAVTTVAALEGMGVAISDNCTADASLTVTSSDGAPTGTCPITITRTYTIKDACNNTATKTQTITINDNVAPVITGTITAASVVGCSSAAAPAAVTTVAALEGMGVAISDNCTADASLTVTSSDGAPTGTCPITITRTYTIKDACNNTATATQTISINDNVAPVITGTITAASVVGCSAASAPAAVTTVAALEGMGVAISDNCTADASLTVTSSDGAPTGTCPITITRTYTIKDACNNTATATQTITINDNVAPVITGTITAANIIGCSAAAAPAAVTTVAALEGMGVAISDNCTADASLTVTSSDGAPTGTCPITITRTYTIKDACNNTATKTQTITINDNVAPVITGTITAANIIGCSAAAAPAAVTTVAALEGMGVAISDNCTADASLTVTSSDGAPTGTCPITITRTYTIKDACNNTATANQTITINDNVAPVITGTITAANIIGCSAGAAPAAVTTVAALEGMGVAISDNCTADASLTVTSSDGAPTGTCPITITRTYTIKDACNNTATATQTITINDNVAPVITGTITAANIIGCSAAAAPAAVTTVAALEGMGVAISDNCTADASLTVTSSDGAPSGTCPITITRTYTIKDACNNTATATQTITINDNVAPIITGTITAASVVGCSAASAPAAVTTVAALEGMGVAISDNCTADASLTVTSSDGAPTGTCPITITRTYTIKDACNNTATATQTITINDNVAPVITGTITAANIAGCNASAAPAAVTTVAALEGMGVAISDNCTADASLIVTSSDGAPAGSCPITIIRTYTIKDGCNNTTTATQNISISGPSLTLPANGSSTVACPASTNTAPTLPTVTDNCGNVITPSAPVISALPTCEGTRTYTYGYTDCQGTVHNWVYTYTVEYQDFTMPADAGSTVSCPAATNTPPTVPTVTDNCGNVLTYTGPVVSPLPVGSGPRTYTYTFTDCEGNTHDWVYTYNVNTSAFSMPPAGASTVNCPNATDAVPTPPSVTDICCNVMTPTGPTVTAKPSCEGTRTYTWTYTDCASTTYTWDYVYTVDIPDFTMPANTGSTVSCPAMTNTAPTVPTVTDFCGNTITPSAPAISPLPTCEGTRTYTYTFSDCAGNSHNWVYTYTIEFNDFTMPANGGSTVNCPALTNTAPTVPTVTDNCGNTLTPSAPVISPLPSCEGTRTYTYTFSDCEGNSHTWVYTYTIEYDDFTMPANGGSTVNCPALTNTAPTVPTVTDNCGNTLTASAPVITAIPTCEGTRTYTYNFMDCEGNTHAWVYTYTVEYDDFTMPANTGSTVSCPALTNTAPTVPTVTDNCGNTLTPSAPVISPVPACEGNRTYTYTFTDCEGNTHNWVYTYTVEMNDFSLPANTGTTVSCPALTNTAPTVPTVTDNCGNTLTPSAPVTSPIPACEGTRTYTYTFTDCEGNNHDWVYTYTIEFNDFSVPANAGSTVSCPAATNTPPTPPTVNDNCGNVITPSAPLISALPTCEGIRTYTYTYQDCEGNSHDWVYTYTIEMNDFTMPANGGSTVNCPALTNNAPVVPTITDNCGNTLTPAAPVITAIPTCEGTRTYTYNFTDCEGNTHPWVYTYTVEYDDFTMPANGGSTVNCPALTNTAPNVPTVTDNCGNTLTPSAPVISPIPTCEGTRTYTYTFSDCEGNSHTWVYTYTVEYDDFTMPANGGSTVNCPALTNTAPIVPTVTDNCGNTLTPAAPVISPVPACEGTRTYTYKFTDCEGNNHDWVYTYTVTYDDFTMPANDGTTVNCPALTNAAPTVPTVTDNCGNTLTPSAPVISPVPACEGTRTYTYTFNDCGGNSHTWVYTYTVEYDDFTMPANAGSTVSCPAATNTPPTVPTVTDNCGNTLTYNNLVVDPIPVGSGSRDYTYTFTDCEGNTHDWVYTYTVNTSAFSMPPAGASTVNCPNATDAVPTPPSVTDICCNVMTPTGPTVTAKPSCEGTRTYTWTYTDCASTTYTWDYVYTVDIPDFTMPANTGSTVSCPTMTNTAPTVPTVTDFCGNTITPSAPIISPLPTCEGTRTYTYTFSDCAGNSHNWVYTYTIEFNDFTMPANGGSTVNCPALTNTAPTVPTVTDNCGNTLTPSAPVISPLPSCEGTRTYTYTFSDCESNSHTWVYTYTVEYDDFTMPANGGSTVNCPALTNTAPTVPTVTDNCGNTLTAPAPVISGLPTCEGTRTYTYNFMDCEGNTHPWVYTYTVEYDDFTMPANAGSTVNCQSATNTPPSLPTVLDNCGNTIAPPAPVISPVTGCETTRTYTYNYTDCEGNVHPWVYTYTITNAAPVINSCPANQTFCMSATGNYTIPAIAATDDCAGALSYSYTITGATSRNGSGNNASGAFSVGTSTISWTVTDACGNSSNCTTTVIVNPAPVVDPITNITVCNGASVPASAFTSSTAGATFAWTNNNTSIGLGASGSGNTPVFTASNSTYSPVTATITVTATANTCAGPASTYTITVNPSPNVVVPSNITVCNNGVVSATSFTSSVTGTAYTWTNSNTNIGLGASGNGNIPGFNATNTGTSAITATITVTPTANTCTGTSGSYTITVNPSPSVTVPANISLCTGATVPALNFSSTTTGATFAWTNSNPSIGLGASGNGNIASFTATNTGTAPVVATITVTATANTCAGTPSTFTITVNPLPQINFPALSGICLNAPATPLSGATPAGGTYSGNGVSNNSFNPMTAGAGTHVITYSYTDANGCSNTATQNITVSPQPSVSITPQDPNICIGTAVNLTANGASTYIWGPGTGLNQTTGSVVSASPQTTTAYIVTGTANGCTNTASVTVNVYTSIPVSVTPANISICPGETTTLTATGAVNYTWTPTATLSSGTGSVVNATPSTTTAYNVTGTDLSGCSGSALAVVNINPLSNISFAAHPKQGCEPLEVDFLFAPGAGIMDNSWLYSFGDNGATSTDTATSHTYNNAGVYAVTLTAQTVDGCNVSAVDTIKVHPTPVADFIAQPNPVTLENPTINFIDNSSNCNLWSWNFGDPESNQMNTSALPNPSHNYSVAGDYDVILIVRNDFGCADTAMKTVTVHDAFAFWIPNAFSPNDDLVNDAFIPAGVGFKEETFIMRIYDRWGKLICETQDITKGWDGKDYISGKMQPDGVYTYQIQVKDETNHEHEYIGSVTLLQ